MRSYWRKRCLLKLVLQQLQGISVSLLTFLWMESADISLRTPYKQCFRHWSCIATLACTSFIRTRSYRNMGWAKSWGHRAWNVIFAGGIVGRLKNPINSLAIIIINGMYRSPRAFNEILL